MTKHEFWCHECDAKVVDSERPETGNFYTVFGNMWSAKGTWNGPYWGVLFALCPDCSVELNLPDKWKMSGVTVSK